MVRNQRFQKPDVLSCVCDYAVLCFLPLKCTSLITNELTFLATYTLMYCSFVIKIKSEILGISLGKQIILTFEENIEKLISLTFEENIENLISNTSISYFILVFSFFLFGFYFFTYLCNEAISEFTLGQQLMKTSLNISLKKSYLPLSGWEKS